MGSFSSVQINLPEMLSWVIRTEAMKLHGLIVEKLETMPHVTVLYGLLPDVPLEMVRTALYTLEPFEIIFGYVNCFPADQNHPEDVLYLEINSLNPMRQLLGGSWNKLPGDGGLDEARARLETLPRDEGHYRAYVPHLTIAYVRQGEGAGYIGQGSGLTGKRFLVDRLYYSTPDYKTLGMHEIELGAPFNPAKIQTSLTRPLVGDDMRSAYPVGSSWPDSFVSRREH